MKKKFSILLILVVAVLTLAVVGYSAWYITRDPKSDTANVTAFEVTGGEISVDTCNSSGVLGDQSIVFGPTSLGGTGWLRFLEGTSSDLENLTVYISVTATGDGGTFNITATNSDGSNKLYNAPTFAFVSGDAGCACTAAGVLTLTDNATAVVSVTYTWGLGSNPFDYFNAAGITKTTSLAEYDGGSGQTLARNVLGNSYAGTTYGQFAKDYLAAVEALNNTTFTITVTDANA